MALLFNILNHSNYANPIKAANSIFTPQAAPTAANPDSVPTAINPATTEALSYTVPTSPRTQFAVKIVFWKTQHLCPAGTPAGPTDMSEFSFGL